ncbi:MAG: hypothetical protein J1F02_09145 [Lachnospiraceae bacterium]|nr:hypothetical protein [Lachnospiraceae bacterium]
MRKKSYKRCVVRKKLRQVMAVLLLFALCAGSMPVPVRAASEEYICRYLVNGGSVMYCYTPDEAFRNCYQKGGSIYFLRDFNLNMLNTLNYAHIGENVTISIGDGVTLTIGEYGLQMDGTINVYGTLDMQSSEGILWGEGKVITYGGCQYKKREYEIEKKGEVCLTAKDITYGQSLAEAEIPEDYVNWISSIEGKWEFVRQDLVPQAGTRNYDVIFQPKYPMTYEEKTFPFSGSLSVRQAVPRMKRYVIPTLHYGEKLLDIQPEYSFANPVTGEEIDGEFVFETENGSVDQIGEQNVTAVFTPTDANYSTVRQYVKVNVVPVEPEIRIEPQARIQGNYGQTLKDIPLLAGKCINPYTGVEVKGSWEWKDSDQRLRLGEHTYSVLFVPEQSGYEMREELVSVTTLPKVMEDISWPESSAITYGESLSESELSFTRNEYGTFAWADERERPGVKNKGAQVVFTPADTDIYDWSRLAGYREEDKTVVFTIPVQVKPQTGILPELSAGTLTEGETLAKASLHIKQDGAGGSVSTGSAGTVVWQNPDTSITRSGHQTALFLPADRDNYDWAFFEPDAEGWIAIPVFVEVKAKEISGTGEKGKDGPKTETPPDETTNQKRSVESSDFLEISAPVIITKMADKLSTIQRAKTVKLQGKTGIQDITRKGSRARIVCRKVKKVKYEVQYSRNKKGKSAKKKWFSKPAFVIRGLAAEKKYYFRVRIWKTVNGRRVYGKWSKRKRG